MKYVLFFLLVSNAVAGGIDWKSMLASAIQQRLQPKTTQNNPQSTTTWIGTPRPGVENIRPRDYLGDVYLNQHGYQTSAPKKTEYFRQDTYQSCPDQACPTSKTVESETQACPGVTEKEVRYIPLDQNKLIKVLSLYQKATLVKPVDDNLPKRVIMILER